MTQRSRCEDACDEITQRNASLGPGPYTEHSNDFFVGLICLFVSLILHERFLNLSITSVGNICVKSRYPLEIL